MTLFSVMTTRIVFAGPLMFFSVLLCFSLFFIPVCYTSSTEYLTNRYECGAHGKFEYCIDGIPGCVIGCHCHPGYYFDTESKICEPNTKLAQDFQRRYLAEPTPTVMDNVPTPTTTTVVTEKVDEIDKDTDDLGDWLFNQFFKTIETQVINNTDDEKPPTRRSGMDVYRPVNIAKHSARNRAEPDMPIMKPMKTKTRKSWKSRGKKRKGKGHGLRRKLLRITEDDSLFDSDSDQDSSGEGSSNDDSSSSGSSSSSETQGSKSKEGRNKDDNNNNNNNKNDGEHGHKKVIIFNRRPRPPLPSFIFLPSMDTPYYPPIGLPPPPVLPMFPLVPVPPMAPVFPFIGPYNGNTTATTAAASNNAAAGGNDAAAADTEATTAAADTPATEPSDAPAPEPEPEALKHPDIRSRPKLHRPRLQMPPKMSEETFLIRARDPPPRISVQRSSPQSNTKQADRMKLVHKLRQRLKKKNKLPPIQDNNVVDLEDDGTLMDETRKQSGHKHSGEHDQELNDVNFKYITELIHRVNRSDTNVAPANVAPADVAPADVARADVARADVAPKDASSKAGSKKLKNVHHSRRTYDSQISNILCEKEHVPQCIPNPEDEHFSNLGRQIASLVRNAESKLDNNVANEHTNPQEPAQSIVQDNSNIPRSYWERSVRSPLTRFKNYFDKLHLDKPSGEKNLFSLEDEVKTFATTVSPLSLQDLENILSTLQKAQAEMKKSKQSADQSNGSLNVNLLPNKATKTENNYRKFKNPVDYAEYFPRSKQLASTPNISQEYTSANSTHYLDPTNLDSPMIDDWLFDTQDYNKQLMNQQTIKQQAPLNLTIEHEIPKYTSKARPVYKKINKQNDYLRFHKIQPLAHSAVINSEVPVKYQEPPINYSELQPKYSEQPTPYPEQPVKVSEPYTKYPDWWAKIAEMSAKYPELFVKYRDLLGNNHDVPVKYPEQQTKLSTLSQKYPDVPTERPMQPVQYSMPILANHNANPSVMNYKSVDYIADTDNKRHYTFEASYPLRIPNYRRRFSKRFESDPGRQSYFHHELHHFDYID